MKLYWLIILFGIRSTLCLSQDILNPYIDYDLSPATDLTIITTNLSYSPLGGATGSYNGEYEMELDEFPWGNQGLIAGPINNWLFDLSNFAVSYQIELVSFPFTIDCAFEFSAQNPSGGCNNMSADRVFNVPDNSFSQSSHRYWQYPPTTSSKTDKLWNRTDKKPFDRQTTNHTISDQVNNNVLVSASFGQTGITESKHNVLPHSILKHTINLHCGLHINNDPIISSFSFYVDLTRGRLREYPFRSNSTNGVNIEQHDLLIRPTLITTNNGVYSLADISNCNFSTIFPGGKCYDGVTVDDLDGVNINYTPFNAADDDFCNLIPAALSANDGDLFFTNSFTVGKLHRLPLANYSLVASTFVRNFNGSSLAGYDNYTGQSTINKINVTPIVHEYTIDKNITLDWINPQEKIIFNPSEVRIYADNLRFPANYTFKTIRGVFPRKSEVNAAESDPLNGGPFTDPTKQDVPVETDLYKDFHVSSSYDPTNSDHRFSSLYHLEAGSKLTIEPCVKIFDATFEINSNSEIVFENWSTNQINVNRYQLLYEGGTITKRNQGFLFQNEAEPKRILHFESDDNILAGENVDPGKPIGEYSVEPNAEVKFTASNFIELLPGFTAKDQSTFEAVISAVTVPACPPMRKRGPSSRQGLEAGVMDQIQYFTFSPNPAQDNSYFMFELTKNSKAIIKIYDIMGNLIFEIGENSFLSPGKYSYNYSPNNLAAGIYLAKLETNSEQKTLKFIKQ